MQTGLVSRHTGGCRAACAGTSVQGVTETRRHPAVCPASSVNGSNRSVSTGRRSSSQHAHGPGPGLRCGSRLRDVVEAAGSLTPSGLPIVGGKQSAERSEPYGSRDDVTARAPGGELPPWRRKEPNRLADAAARPTRPAKPTAPAKAHSPALQQVRELTHRVLQRWARGATRPCSTGQSQP